MNKMTAAGYIRAVENHCNTLHPAEPEDYKKDGLLYCGKCHTSLECVIRIPITGEIHAVPIACACRAAEHERYKAELARKITEEHRKQALPLEKYRKMTFEASDIPLPFAEKYVSLWDEMLRNNIGLMLFDSVGTGNFAKYFVMQSKVSHFYLLCLPV